MTADATTGHAFIANEGDGTVTVIDTTGKVVKTITAGGRRIEKVAIDPTAGLAYVTGVDYDGALDVVDTKTLKVVTTMPRPEGERYWGGLADPSTGFLYAGSAGSVLVITRR